MLRLIAYGGLGAALTAMVIAVGAWGVLRAIPPDPPAPYTGMTGMEILQAHACHRAETKEIIVRGVEDNFSPDGEERAVIREALRTPLMMTRTFADYDHDGLDAGVIDHMMFAPHVTGGVIVITMRGNGGGWENDRVGVGDMSYIADGSRVEVRRTASALLQEADTISGWIWTGRHMVIDVAAAQFGSWRRNDQGDQVLIRDRDVPDTLLDHVRSHDEPVPVDVFISDDMSVDFMGAALCLEPQPRRGVTLNLTSNTTVEPAGTVIFTPAADSPGETQGDPFSGDTLCSQARPLLCFLDRGEPVPDIDPVLLERAGEIWSGGEVRATDPVAGDQFETLADARAMCAEAFGADWRVATFHDGNHAGLIHAFGEMEDPHPPVWVDIRGQPHATCWEPAP